LLDIIILVPYNLFRLFLVHKTSIYIHIYIMEKKRTKEKDKEFSVSWAQGGIWPSRGARGQAAHLACQRGNGAGTAPWAWAHVPEGGGGDGVRGG
jgi:hypothetical protein